MSAKIRRQGRPLPKAAPRRARTLWRQFAMALVEKGSAVEAYRTIWPGARSRNPNNVRVAAHKLLKENPEVWQIVDTIVAQKLEESGIRADAVLSELGLLAYSDITNVVTWNQFGGAQLRAVEDLPPEVRRTIKKVKTKIVQRGGTGDDDPIFETTVEVELHDKLSALNSLTRVLKMVSDARTSLAQQEEAQGAGPLEEEQPQRVIAFFPHKLGNEEWLREYAPGPPGQQVAVVHPSAPPPLLASNGHPNGK